MLALELEELHLLLAFLLVDGASLLGTSLDGVDACLQLNHLVELRLLFVLKITDFLDQSVLTMLSLQLFAHGKSYGAKKFKKLRAKPLQKSSKF